MKLLITGSVQPLGKLLCGALAKNHHVQGIDRDTCDHRDLEALASLCVGIDAVLHCDVFDPPEDLAEIGLDWATRGTYVLMQAARSAGVERVIVASRLSLFDAYPAHYVVDETWQPKPQADAGSLAPYLAELTCREFARQGGICAVGLRLAELGSLEGTTESDVVTAVQGALALELEPEGYRWQVFHVSSGGRFPMRSARRALGFDGECE
jgi:nucleoside-diphosphate-sugar epimerase